MNNPRVLPTAPLVSFALNRQWFRCIIRYFATSILKIITQCFFMFFCVYHSFFQLASFYRIELFQPCIKAFLYRHFCFQTSVFSLFRSKVTELLFQKEKLVAVCQTNFSRNHAGISSFLGRSGSLISSSELISNSFSFFRRSAGIAS